MKKQKAKVIKLMPKNKAVVDEPTVCGRNIYHAKVLKFYSKAQIEEAKEYRDAAIKLGYPPSPIEFYLD